MLIACEAHDHDNVSPEFCASDLEGQKECKAESIRVRAGQHILTHPSCHQNQDRYSVKLCLLLAS